jgi:hypothetical protein
VCNEDIELARFQIASKRLLLDDAINAIEGVHFFISSITSVCSNSKSKVEEEPTYMEPDETYPSIAYVNDNTFFTALHNQDLGPVIQGLKVRNVANNELENAARQLFQTVKDHNNRSIQDMLDMSNVYCYRNAQDSSTGEENDEEEYDEEFHPTHFPSAPCCVTIVNHDSYLDAIQSAIERLQSDGLVLETSLSPQVDTIQSLSQPNEITRTIRKIARVRLSAATFFTAPQFISPPPMRR